MQSFSEQCLLDRQRPLAELDALIAEARARCVAAVVRMAGPPGIGKTAFLRHVLAQRGDLSEALWSSAEPNDSATPGLSLLRALGLDRSIMFDEGKLISALCNALDKHPVLCIDDVQWLDEVSRRAFHAALSGFGERITVLICDRREDAPELAPHRTIYLAPLRPSAAGSLVRAIYPDAPRAVVDEIVAASSGLPFDVVFLAESAARDDAKSPDYIEQSTGTALARRLERCGHVAREALRHFACLEGSADARHVARALDVDLQILTSALTDVTDLVAVHDLQVDFRHASIVIAIRATIKDSLPYYARLLSALDEDDDRTSILATRLRCAQGCGADAIAASCALRLGRALASSGALEASLQYLEVALRHAPRPLPLPYSVDFAGVLQQLSRDEEAAVFLRREINAAIERGHSRTAGELIVSFCSIALTLEHPTELETLCDRVGRLIPFDPEVRPLLLTARLASAAFSGMTEEYDRLASGATLRWADWRPAAFISALRGDAEGSIRGFESYRGALKAEHARQDPSDLILRASVALFESGPNAIDIIENPGEASRGVRAHPAAAGLRIFRRIADGRWDAASALLREIPLWDPSYQEPYGILDIRLLHAALARRIPDARNRTVGSLRRMIARRQFRHVVSPARWYVVAVSSSGSEAESDITAFVAETLDIPPMPYLFGSLPLAVALLTSIIDGDRCSAALSHWPRYGSRWHSAHLDLASAVISHDHSLLRSARNAFDDLNAPLFAMLAGIELPVPRARDLALAAMLGPYPARQQPLTARERDVAELAASGERNRDIALKLKISERTVEVHLTNAYRKLKVRSRSSLAQRLTRRQDLDVS